MTQKKNKINSILWCLVIYIQYIMMPVESVFGLVFVKYLVVLGSVLISIIINGIRIDFLKIFSFLSVLFLLDFIIFKNVETFNFFYISMFSSSLIMLFFTMNLKDIKLFFGVYYKYSLLTLFSVLLYIVISKGNTSSTISYMAIGNVLSFISIPLSFRLYFIEDKKFKNHLLLIFLLILSVFFANRMSMITIFLIYQVPKFFLYKSKKENIKMYLFTLIETILLLICILNIDLILNFILQFINGNTSYVLIKLERMISDSEGLIQGIINSSSGRDILYDKAVDSIISSYGFPQGISGFNVVGSSGIVFYYPHNVILELLINFGVFGIPIILYFLFRLYQKYVQSDENLKFFILCFFIFSFSRSLVSSSIWLSPSLWTCFGTLYINSNKKNRKKL
ncbi:hypothetical protein [Vagococcus sp. CY53-2]|uniref:hypothetical protein n=1 Tax=Vagococcus sp. CY53-2 TaxID=2925780 RepID=UPI001F5111C8|nr:hypothetical protein [Vagococcus sp. CY53-2]MCI0130540.1 hypothetical protein [Vagococcus sp. CY53-2]